MPLPSHTSAPTFDMTQPCELRLYFDDLDILFTECSIIDIHQQTLEMLIEIIAAIDAIVIW
jgi:hypothetical protein